jgi:hypothetical protein
VVDTVAPSPPPPSPEFAPQEAVSSSTPLLAPAAGLTGAGLTGAGLTGAGLTGAGLTGAPSTLQPRAEDPLDTPSLQPFPQVSTRADLPQPGALGIKERRSWRSWQLALVAVVALGAGMGLNQWASGGSPTAPPTGGADYKVPPAAASGTTATTAAAGTTAPTTAATTTTASTKTNKKGATKGSTTIAPAGSSATTTTAAATTPTGALTTLLSPYQSSGNGTSTAFTVGGGSWNIGYDYQCTPPPAAGPAFQVFVVTKGGTPGATPAISGTAASGQAVTPQTTTGTQQLVIEAASSFRWVVKVTGYS